VDDTILVIEGGTWRKITYRIVTIRTPYVNTMLDALPQAVQNFEEASRAAPQVAHFPLTPNLAEADDSADENVNILVGLIFLPM